ncbi:MAG: response regulator transcription factor [Pedobacter sp.]|nr:MAG: response regulator transcription factor [Pedobacter sp.]
MRILVADDEQLIRFGLKLVLKGLWPDVSISEAESLDGVVSLLTVLTFDLVILDIHMPGSDGLENLIRFMLAETKVIIFSGYEPTSPRIESLREAGVDEFIFKNASLDEIRLTLKEHFPDTIIE